MVCLTWRLSEWSAPGQSNGVAAERSGRRVPAADASRLLAASSRPGAEEACKCHFGECEWTMDEAEFVPCVGSIGGRVRLYEGRFVASS